MKNKHYYVGLIVFKNEIAKELNSKFIYFRPTEKLKGSIGLSNELILHHLDFLNEITNKKFSAKDLPFIIKEIDITLATSINVTFSINNQYDLFMNNKNIFNKLLKYPTIYRSDKPEELKVDD